MKLPPISPEKLQKLKEQGYVGHECSNIKCNKEVDPRRYKAANNYKSKDMQRFVKVLCEHCVSKGNDVGLVGGVTLIRGKNDYSSVQIVPRETARRVHKLADRKGQSPSGGMKNGVN